MQNVPKNKVLATILVIALLIIFIIGIAIAKKNQKPVTTFDDCKKAKGSIVMESYPEQCRTKDGKTFVQPTPTEDPNSSGGYRVIKSSKVAITTLTKGEGASSQITENSEKIISNSTEYTELLTKLSAPTPDTKVNFDQETVIAILQGQKPSGSFSTEITDILETDTEIVINYKEKSPSPECISTTVITSPFHLVKIPKTTKKVVFAETKETVKCQ
jgi:hypothetical protein